MSNFESSPTVVLLAFHYPPMVGPASERAASFARHLPSAGWTPSVVTVTQGLFHSEESNRPPEVPTLRTRSPEPSKLLGPLRRRRSRTKQSQGGGTSEVGTGTALGVARRFVRDYLYVPDGQAPWIPLAVIGARRAVRASEGSRVLLSTSVPYSAHLAALVAARLERVPWVAEFRDPWAQRDDRTRPRSWARKRIDAALEKLVVESAAAVVVTSASTCELMSSSYPGIPKKRFWVVRNGFEPIENPQPPPGPDAALELVHAGSVSREVRIEPLLRGIDRVARAEPGALRFRVLGSAEPWQRSAEAIGEPRWLEIEGLVSPVAARRAITSASANVLLRPGDHHNQYVAAKLMEYLGARRPIVGIVSATGEMAGLGRDYGDMRLVSDYNEDYVAAEVERLIAEHRRGALAESVRGRRPVEELSRREQTLALARVLESIACRQ